MAHRASLCLALAVLLVQGQRIAERKCEEYRGLTIKKVRIITLFGNVTSRTFVDCPKTVNLILVDEVNKNEFPHQALLGWKQSDDPVEYKFQCGGSLISERYVLTAAYCFRRGKPDIVRLGEHSIDDDTDGQVDFEIESVQMHPDYKYRVSYNDIALIKLNANVRFSRAIRPACLWTGENINVTSVFVTGFGSMDTAWSSSNVIRKVAVEFVDRHTCESQYIGRRFSIGIVDEQLCIGSKTGDSCPTDAGGPLQVLLEPNGCLYHIVGIASLGPPVCHEAPAIYTRVSSYLDWLEGIVWNDE